MFPPCYICYLFFILYLKRIEILVLFSCFHTSRTIDMERQFAFFKNDDMMDMMMKEQNKNQRKDIKKGFSKSPR